MEIKIIAVKTPADCQKCICVNIGMGSTKNQTTIIPFWGGRPVGIDNCVLPDILALWRQGIRTIESCCGHKKNASGYISVALKDVEKMKALGWREESPERKRPDIFLWPKVS